MNDAEQLAMAQQGPAIIMVPREEMQRLLSTAIAAAMQGVSDASSLERLLAEVGIEVARAESLWPPINSAHEGYAVILEELDELKEHAWANQNRRDVAAMRKEAVQLAAMALRFLRDVCDGGRERA